MDYKKNIIFLTKDILRSDYLRCYNPNSHFNTKNIDAKKYYNLLKFEKNKIWRTGNFLNEYSGGLRSRLNLVKKVAVFNASKRKKPSHFVEGRWDCKKARVNV